MKYLNLTEGFNPYNAKPQDCIDFEAFVFNGGEPYIKIKSEITEMISLTITIKLDSAQDLMLLAVARDAIEQLGVAENIFLFIPYFPGARQDRVMVKGEALTVRVYADIINNMEFNEVIIYDPHSDVAPAVLDNCTVISNHNFVDAVLSCIKYPEDIQLISPDAGANKKVLKLAQHLGIPNIIKCDKVRNVVSGELTGFQVYADDLKGKPCIIVDDICDGGGTFMGLAAELQKKNAGLLYLAVSHGIFSKGLGQLCSVFKGVYATDSVDTTRFVQSVPLNYREVQLGDVI